MHQKRKTLYNIAKSNSIDLEKYKTPHSESRKIVNELRSVKDECFGGHGLTHEQYNMLEEHLSVVMNMRDHQLCNKHTNVYRCMCTTSRYLNCTVLDTVMAKLIACVELLPEDKARMVLGDIKRETERLESEGKPDNDPPYGDFK